MGKSTERHQVGLDGFGIAAAVPDRPHISPTTYNAKAHNQQINAGGMMETQNERTGVLAEKFGNANAPLQILKSAAGYYIGTLDEDGLPFTRESACYWHTRNAAEHALQGGEFPQKPSL